jgi:hypothetical protein
VAVSPFFPRSTPKWWMEGFWVSLGFVYKRQTIPHVNTEIRQTRTQFNITIFQHSNTTSHSDTTSVYPIKLDRSPKDNFGFPGNLLLCVLLSDGAKTELLVSPILSAALAVLIISTTDLNKHFIPAASIGIADTAMIQTLNRFDVISPRPSRYGNLW